MSDQTLAAFDSRAFRRALGNFATGVTVVTAADAAGHTFSFTAAEPARSLEVGAYQAQVSTELERIGDYAKGICKINLLMSEDPIDPLLFVNLQQMAFISERRFIALKRSCRY